MGPFPEHLLLQLVNIWQGRGRLSLQQGGRSPQTSWDIVAVPSPGPVPSPGNSRRDPTLPEHPAHLRTCRRSCQWLCSASSSCSFSWHRGCRWVDLKACLQQDKATRVSPAGTALSPGPPQSLRGEARGRRPEARMGRDVPGHSCALLTGTGRALEVEDGLQVVGLVKLQVEGVLSLRAIGT